MSGLIKSEEELSRIQVGEIKEIIKPFYVQLYEYNDNDVLKPIGSGFLIEYSAVFYILSAGHVIANKGSGSYGPLKKHELVNVDGQSYYFGYHTAGETNFKDKDCVTILISKESAAAIKEEFKFYLPSPTEFTHPVYNSQKFIVSGASYKSSKPEYSTGNINAILQNIRTKEASPEVYKKLKLDRKDFLILDYERSRIIDMEEGGKIDLGELDGMSGSPIWAVKDNILGRAKLDDLKLCAILTYHHKKEKVLIGNRISTLKTVFDKINE